MSYQIFPQLSGLSIERTKTPEWKTVIHQSVSGKETRAQFMSSPIWNFTLIYNALLDENNDLGQIMSFYNAMSGSYTPFLYLDPSDNSETNQTIAVGDGSSTSFQIVRNQANYVEPIQNISGTPSIYLNGVLQTSGYTIGSTGIITFTNTPTVGTVISWSGNFYFLVRFKSDTLDFTQFLSNTWEAKKIELRSVKL